MLFNTQTFALAGLFSAVVIGRPLDSSKPRDVAQREKSYAVVNVGGESSKPRDIIPRDKSYAVVNVGGDQSTEAPPPATSVIKTTKTVEVVSPGATITQEVTTTVKHVPSPTPTQSTSCTSSTLKAPPQSPPAAESWTPAATSEPIAPTPTSESILPPVISTPAVTSQAPAKETPKPIFVTVTVSTDDGPTSYYDDGMWHTYYRIKTFEAAAVATAA